MDYKILNEEYRIAAAKIPRKTPGISICYSRADVILINDDAAGLDGIVELFATYLDLDDLGRLLWELMAQKMLRLGIWWRQQATRKRIFWTGWRKKASAVLCGAAWTVCQRSRRK